MPPAARTIRTATSFAYDSAHRAREARSSYFGGSFAASFRWDASGTLAALNLDAMSWSVAYPVYRERHYGPRMVERYVRDEDSVQVERRIPGPLGTLALLRDSDTGSEILYPQGDHRAPELYTNAGGERVQLLDYSPFGHVTKDTGDVGAPDYSRMQWNYGTALKELGVTLLGPRLYDPRMGRFLQRDPVMIAGASSKGNPYSFAFNDPINHSDPSGLFPNCGGGTIFCSVWATINPYASTLMRTFAGWFATNAGYSALRGVSWYDVALDEVVDRGIGVLQAGAGLAAMKVGAAMCTTGVGCVVGGGLAVWGADVAGAGVQRTISGEPEKTLGGTLFGEKFQQVQEATVNGAALAGGVYSFTKPSYVRPAPPDEAAWAEALRGTTATKGAGSAAARGGPGPVRQGAAGVERAVTDLEAAGGRVLGREVTIEAGGVRTRPDLFVELPSGQRAFLEIKTGASAGLTVNQAIAFPQIWTQGGIPWGAKAVEAGLVAGLPIGPTPVWTVFYSWPLP